MKLVGPLPLTCAHSRLSALHSPYLWLPLPLLLISLLAFPASSPSLTWHITSDGLGDAPTIQAAVHSSAVGDSILVAEGTFHENVILEPGRILIGSWNAEFTESNLQVFPTVIDGDSLSSCIQADFGSVQDAIGIVAGFVLRDGVGTEVRAEPGGRALRKGGGLYGVGLQRLERCIIENNFADEGGGIYVSADVVLIDGFEIVGNGAVNYGAGAYVNAGIHSTIKNTNVHENGFSLSLPFSPFSGPGLYLKGGPCLVESVQSSFNRVDAYFNGQPDILGGGICSLCSSLTVRNSRITDNRMSVGEDSAALGGGIYADSLIVENTVIARNECIYGYGGGIYATKCRLVDCDIVDNEGNAGKLWGFGGGVNAGQAEIIRCLIQGNYCAGLMGANGGGISSGALTLRNSVIRGNVVNNHNSINSGRGAGIAAQTLDAANIIVKGNFCSVEWPAQGVGIWLGLGNGTIRSSIISDHSSSTKDDLGVIFGNVQSISNLFFNNEPALFAGGNVDSSGHIHANPKFANVAGGDFHLLLHSPGIDHGDPGEVDPDGSRADVGAFGGPGAIMGQPARVKAAEGHASSQSILLKWSPVAAGDLLGYAIYRAETPGIHPGQETLLDLPQGVGTSFVDRSVTPNKTYFYRVSAYDSSGYGGGYSDEVEVVAVPRFGNRLGEGEGAEATETALLAPKVDRFGLRMRGANPCRGPVAFELAIPQAKQVELTVFDLSGRRVWSEVRSLEAGISEIRWDGTRHDGSHVAAGVYLVKARAAGESSMQRVVLLR